MQPATGEGLCYNLKRNDNGNTDVDGGPRGGQIGAGETKSRELCGPGV